MTIRLMDTVNISLQTEEFIKATGAKIKNMAKASKVGLMEPNLKEFTATVRKTVRENLHGRTEINTSGSIGITSDKGKAS